MTKILFLDIDGVINSQRTCIAFNGYPHNFCAVDMAKFDHVAIALIRKLCHIAGCNVVLSSSWRYTFRVDATGEALDLPMIGATPKSKGFDTRGEEIDYWLKEHPDVTHYAIVDDCEKMLPHQDQFYVQTDPDIGLTLADYKRLLSILTRELEPA